MITMTDTVKKDTVKQTDAQKHVEFDTLVKDLQDKSAAGCCSDKNACGVGCKPSETKKDNCSGGGCC